MNNAKFPWWGFPRIPYRFKVGDHIPICSRRTGWLSKELQETYEIFFLLEYESLSRSGKYQFFVEHLSDKIRKHTPIKRKVPPDRHRNPVAWWDSECDKAKRLSRAAYKKWTFTKSEAEKIKLYMIRLPRQGSYSNKREPLSLEPLQSL